MNQRKRYIGLLVQHLLPLLNLGSSQKCSQLVFSIDIILVDVHLNRLNWFRFLVLVEGPLIILIDCMIFLSQFLGIIRTFMSTVSFFTQLYFGILCLQNASLWPMIYIALILEFLDPRHLLSLGSF